ncbi:LysR family transcriptional regulator [Enterococcus sp. AZ196]|uniref:LysR family transcriptional regulator n=1 Tax=Enterococcus sp. AZ196 TaxID=2774659 RepID=UPI003D26A43F
MNFEELKCFQKVYQLKSMNRAAKELFLTAQGVGRIINKLENELNARFFVRSVKGMEPTRSAEILYEHSQELLDKFSIINAAIQQENERENKLTLHCARGSLNALSFDGLAHFIEDHKEIEISWSEMPNDEVKNSIYMRQANAGLVIGKTNLEDVDEVFIARRETKVLIYEGHPLYMKEVITPADLANERIVILNQKYQIFHEFNHYCERNNISPKIVGLTEDSHLLYKLCQSGQGLGIILDFSVDAFDMKKLKMIPLETPIYWDVYLIYPHSNELLQQVEWLENYLLSCNKKR